MIMPEYRLSFIWQTCELLNQIYRGLMCRTPRHWNPYNKLMFREPEGKQVSLKVFDNEPTARMAEQRLNLEGVRCLVKSLRGGPGLWGTAFNLPHDLLVHESDEMQARDILKIPPNEVIEQQLGFDSGHEKPSPVISPWRISIIIVVVALIAFTIWVIS